MSVLMKKPELVKRYCCVLHILEGSLDLINDEKQVSTAFVNCNFFFFAAKPKSVQRVKN